jgi:hypothetical protein
MKKLFLNPRFLHLFYGSLLLLFIAYFVFIMQNRTQEYNKASMKDNFEISDQTANSLRHEIDNQVKAYPNIINKMYGKRCNRVEEMTNEIIQYIDNQRIESDVSIAELHQKIRMLNDTIQSYINPDDNKYFEKTEFWKVLLSDVAFWDGFKGYYWKDKNFLLDQVKLGVLNEKIHFYNYVFQKVGGVSTTCGGYVLAFNPFQNMVRVGEKFEADIGIVEYSTADLDIQYMIDKDTLLQQNGYAHFQKTFSKPGKYIIHPKAYIKNPFTEQVNRVLKDYEIIVLPK